MATIHSIDWRRSESQHWLHSSFSGRTEKNFGLRKFCPMGTRIENVCDWSEHSARGTERTTVAGGRAPLRRIRYSNASERPKIWMFIRDWTGEPYSKLNSPGLVRSHAAIKEAASDATRRQRGEIAGREKTNERKEHSDLPTGLATLVELVAAQSQ